MRENFKHYGKRSFKTIMGRIGHGAPILSLAHMVTQFGDQ